MKKSYDMLVEGIKKGHKSKDKYAEEFKECIRDIVENPVVQEMKCYNHHSHTNCFEHSVHVAYYNFIVCKMLGLDYRSAARAGMLHDLFLYDWHTHRPKRGERLHGFEHPKKALKNAQENFMINDLEKDMIKKHMFPLTLGIPKYKETFVIVMTDKFCSSCEVLDRFFKKSKRDTF